MLREKLKKYHIILASESPRRQAHLKDLGIDFEIRVKAIEERYPNGLVQQQITNYLAVLKSKPFKGKLREKDILLTFDTIVWHEGKALGKPKDALAAFQMLKSLSGQSHEVYTSVCFTTSKEQRIRHDLTRVHFKDLSNEEIKYYISQMNPLDKAGAYGIQEWIGQIGIKKIEGSFYNVLGLPLHLIYQTLVELTSLRI